MQTDKDYHDNYLSYKRTDWSEGRRAGYVHPFIPPKVMSIPDSIDWRAKSAVTAVKHQVKSDHSSAEREMAVFPCWYRQSVGQATHLPALGHWRESML